MGTGPIFVWGQSPCDLLDAGEHGGLELRGGWSINKTECNFMNGAGNWSLGGDVDATGGFIVNSGKLLIPSNTKYEWYRLTFMGSFAEATNASGIVMSTLPNNDGSRFILNQWALLDENGVNQITNLTHNTAADG